MSMCHDCPRLGGSPTAVRSVCCLEQHGITKHRRDLYEEQVAMRRALERASFDLARPYTTLNQRALRRLKAKRFRPGRALKGIR